MKKDKEFSELDVYIKQVEKEKKKLKHEKFKAEQIRKKKEREENKKWEKAISMKQRIADELSAIVDSEESKKKLDDSIKELDSLKANYENYKKSKSINSLKEQFEERKEEIVKEMSNFHKMILQLYDKNKKFEMLNEREKLDFVSEMEDYKQIVKDWPVVTRYIILDKQFSSHGLREMIRRMQSTKPPPPDVDRKKYMHDNWCDQQSRYVCDIYKQVHYAVHPSPAEIKFIYEKTYEQLQKEYNNFKNKHSEVEEEVSTRRRKVKGQNTRLLLNHIKNNDVEINDSDFIKLEENLLIMETKVKFKSVLEQLKVMVNEIEPIKETMGKCSEFKKHQTVRVNATVDDDQEKILNEDSKYRRYLENSTIEDDYEILNEEDFV